MFIFSLACVTVSFLSLVGAMELYRRRQMRRLKRALEELELNDARFAGQLADLHSESCDKTATIRFGLGVIREMFAARREELSRKLRELAARKSPLHTLRQIVHL